MERDIERVSGPVAPSVSDQPLGNSLGLYAKRTTKKKNPKLPKDHTHTHPTHHTPQREREREREEQET
jgi:hypothetical protein